jgi:Family of unknown function (DUF6338)
MKLDEIGLKILFLLFPGIIAYGIICSIGPKRPRSDFQGALQIFAYGVVSYALAGFLEGVYAWKVAPTPGASFWQTVGEKVLSFVTLNPQAPLGVIQIVYATGAAIFLGSAVANLQKHSLPHLVLRKCRLTRRTNEIDIWEYTLNAPNLRQWVTVRHHSNGKIYQGWVQAYSDGGDERELLLTEVKVFAPVQDTNEVVEIDQVPVLYLGLDRKNAVVELSPAQ